MKRVIVTGASGFLGNYVIDGLLGMGYYVIGISRRGSVNANKNYSADLCDEHVLKKIFIKETENEKKIDGVIHLAANISIPGDAVSFSDNCKMTYHIMKCALQYHCDFLIHLSSIPVIGKPLQIPIDEDHKVQPETFYHLSKYMNELLINAMSAGELKAIHLRIPSPIGKGMNERAYLSVILDKFMNGQPLEVYGTGNRVQNYIDVRDIAYAIDKAVMSGQAGLYLIAGNESISNMELARKCKEICKSDSVIQCNKQKVDSEEQNRWIISTQKAENQLGFQTRYSLEDTIKWMIGKEK